MTRQYDLQFEKKSTLREKRLAMSNENVSVPVEEDKIVLKVRERERINAPAEKTGWMKETVRIAAKGVIGAAVGVAGGMVLVTAGAVIGGAVLSWSAFATVLGIAGAAGGVSHGVVSLSNKN